MPYTFTFDLVNLLPGKFYELNDAEEHILRDILSNSVYRKYLQTLMANSIVENTNIEVSFIAEEGATKYALMQAYHKGYLSALITLHSYQKPKAETPSQAPQNT